MSGRVAFCERVSRLTSRSRAISSFIATRRKVLPCFKLHHPNAPQVSGRLESRIQYMEHSHGSDCRWRRQGKRCEEIASIATNANDGFTMVAVGDLLVRRPLTNGRDSGFGAIVSMLREADAVFGNLETNIFDIRAFKGSPQAEHGGEVYQQRTRARTRFEGDGIQCCEPREQPRA